MSIYSKGVITADTLSTVSGHILVNNQFEASGQSINITSINSGLAAYVYSFGDIDVSGAITTNGDISLNNPGAIANIITLGGAINAGSGSAAFETDNGGSINFEGASINARNITFNTGTLSLSLINTLSAGVDVNGDAGDVSVSASSITTSGGALFLQAIGTGTGDGEQVSLLQEMYRL